MNAGKPLALLLALLAVALGVAWQLRARGAGGAAVASPPAVARSGAGPVEPLAAPQAELDGARSEEPPEESPGAPIGGAPAPERTAAVVAPAHPAGWTWVEGRVVLPPGIPPDEEIAVLALGDWTLPGTEDRVYRATPDADGRFRAAFAVRGRFGSFEVEGGMLLLPERVQIDLRAPSELVVLRPILAGRLEGTFALSDAGRRNAPDLFFQSVVLDRGPERSGRGTLEPDDGTFDLGVVMPADDYTVGVEARQHTLAFEANVAVEPGRTTRVHLRELSSVAGRVVDAGGRPIAAARVWTSRADDQVASGSADTDREGRYVLWGLGAAEWTLQALHAGWLRESVELGWLPQGTHLSEVDVVLHRGDGLTGRVTWPDGTPLFPGHVFVGARETQDAGEDGEELLDRRRRPVSMAELDEHGRFELHGLPEREYELAVVTADPARPRTRRVAARAGVVPGGDQVELVLEPRRRLFGVVLRDGQPFLGGFLVSARPSHGWSRDERGEVYAEFAPGDASFELVGLPSGGWDVWAWVLGEEESPRVEVYLPNGDVPVRLELGARDE